MIRNVGVGLALAGLAIGGTLLAQEGQDPPPQAPEAAGDTVQLVFEREVFTYPSQARRNPFRPLTDGGDAGPRFEQLVFLGAISSADPGGSVALLGIRTGGPDGPTYRMRVGQSIGNTRIIEIRPRQLIVEVEEFGLRERRTLELQRTAPEAAGPGPGETPEREDPEPVDPPDDTIPDPVLDTASGPGLEEHHTPESRLSGEDTILNGNGGT
jgi:hypothetical protein